MKQANKTRAVAKWLVGALVVFAADAALAQEKDKKKKDDGYGYEFTDDPLSAGGLGPGDSQIKVRTGPIRQTLIRPRTSFVPEMLKSVQNL